MDIPGNTATHLILIDFNGCDKWLKLYTYHTARAREQTNNTREDMETRRLIITTENQIKFCDYVSG